jgi:hypothetical protein
VAVGRHGVFDRLMVDAPSWFSSLRPLASWLRERERERRRKWMELFLGSCGQLGSETSGAGLLVCLYKYAIFSSQRQGKPTRSILLSVFSFCFLAWSTRALGRRGFDLLTCISFSSYNVYMLWCSPI